MTAASISWMSCDRRPHSDTAVCLGRDLSEPDELRPSFKPAPLNTKLRTVRQQLQNDGCHQQVGGMDRLQCWLYPLDYGFYSCYKGSRETLVYRYRFSVSGVRPGQQEPSPGQKNSHFMAEYPSLFSKMLPRTYDLFLTCPPMFPPLPSPRLCCVF